MMFGRVGMAGEAHRMAAPFEELKQRLPVDEVLPGLVAERGLDWDVKDDDDERIVRRELEHAAHELELPLVEPALVLARAARLLRVEAEIVDVVEHEEERL